MRLLRTSLAACICAVATAAIAGCGPTVLDTVSPAGSVSAASPAASSAAGGSPVAGEALASPATAPATSTASPQVDTATIAPGDPRTPTALTIAMTLPVQHPSQTTAVIAGRLSEPASGDAALAGRVVWLERLGAGGWLLFRDHVTGADGRVAFQVHVVVGAAFRLVYAGNADLARSVSPVRVVT